MLSNLASISKSLLAAFRRAWAFLKFNGCLKGFWVGIFVYFCRFIEYWIFTLAGICFVLESDVCNVHICQVTKFSLSWWTVCCPLWYWPPDPYRCYSLSMCHNSKPVITSSCFPSIPGPQRPMVKLTLQQSVFTWNYPLLVQDLVHQQGFTQELLPRFKQKTSHTMQLSPNRTTPSNTVRWGATKGANVLEPAHWRCSCYELLPNPLLLLVGGW